MDFNQILLRPNTFVFFPLHFDIPLHPLIFLSEFTIAYSRR